MSRNKSSCGDGWMDGAWKDVVGATYIKGVTGIEPSRKTLYNLKKKLVKTSETSGKQPEREVDWTNLKAIETHSNITDRQLLQELYALWGKVRHAIAISSLDAPPLPFTYRKLKWLSFMQTYHAKTVTKTADKLAIAAVYSTREIWADWSDTEIQREDLDAWLFYKPWLNDKYMGYYLSLIKKGSIPDLEASKFTSCVSAMAAKTADNHNYHHDNSVFVYDSLKGALRVDIDPENLVSIFNVDDFEAVCELTGANKYVLPTKRLENKDTKELSIEYLRRLLKWPRT